MAPFWIQLPNLPLHCWDEINICRIASMVGKPILLDGNMFQWGRCEFDRVYARIKLDCKLPLSVWVEGSSRKFFQNIEYERIPIFYYSCGMIGHCKEDCINVKINFSIIASSSEKNLNSNSSNSDEVYQNKTKEVLSKDNMGYGPWLIINKRRNISSNSRRILLNPRVSSTWKKVERKNTLPILGKDKLTLDSTLESTEENPSFVEVNNSSLSKEHEPGSNYSIHTTNNKLSVLLNHIEEGEIIQDFQKHVEIGEKTVKPVESSQPDLLQIAETGLESAGKSLAKKKKSKHLKDLRPISSHSRIRRLDMESKGTVGASSPTSHQ
ncbi:uncharacterized protein LOC110098789 [Dendrobium catenatum]|uniref:uncharacterized protein LOC110098789 n=1 Tax=Dendrobium catenatum TaxID=906689 RepID=UPI0009F6ABCE|nr:uncharacterized protein LOC110098789 [Dendrobium catenatum]